MRENALRRDLEEVAPAFRLEPHYTVAELSQTLKIGQNAIYHLIKNGDLKAFAFGATWRISQSAVDRFISTRIRKQFKRGRGRTENVKGKFTPLRNRELATQPGSLNPAGIPPSESATDHSSTS